MAVLFYDTPDDIHTLSTMMHGVRVTDASGGVWERIATVYEHAWKAISGLPQGSRANRTSTELVRFYGPLTGYPQR